jgi:hypothetical protein
VWHSLFIPEDEFQSINPYQSIRKWLEKDGAGVIIGGVS